MHADPPGTALPRPAAHLPWSTSTAALALLALAGLGLTLGPSTERLERTVRASPGEIASPAPPCGLEMDRAVAPRAVVAGQAVTVSARWRYACDVQARRATDLLLLIDISAGLDDASGRLLPQLEEGLSRVVSRLPVEGSRLGLIAFDTRTRIELPLAAGRDAIDQRLEAIRSLEHTGSGFSDLQVPLARARELLASPTAPAVVMLIDVGASQPPTRSSEEILAECMRLREGGARVAIASLAGSNARFGACASPGGHQVDPTSDVRLLPGLLGGLASAWIGDPDLLLSEWHEPVDGDTWTYVEGSGRPRGPDALRGEERWWQEHAVAGAGDHALAWQLRAPEVGETVIRRLTSGEGPFVALVDRAGHSEAWRAATHEVCVHPPDRAADCAPYLAGLTATAAAPTPRATGTPTQLPPSATPTRTHTPDPVVDPTPTPEATSVVPPTATRTETPSPSEERLWLPVGWRP